MAQTPTQPNLNDSPKTRFQQSADNVSKHNALVTSRDFQRACDFSMLQYQAYLASQSVDGNGAAASHFKMLGAQEYLATFRTLGSQPQIPKVLDRDNLTQPN